jgi:hypothetical protein
MKLNPYQIGMNFYIILIILILTFVGCKEFERWKEKKEIEQILQTPDLTKNKK